MFHCRGRFVITTETHVACDYPRPPVAGCPLFLSLSLCPMGHFPTFPPTWSSLPPPPKRQACERGRFRHVCVSTRKGLRLGSGLSAEGSELAKLGCASSQPIQTNDNLSKVRQKTCEVDPPSLDEQDERGLLVRVGETLHSPVRPAVCLRTSRANTANGVGAARTEREREGGEEDEFRLHLPQ